MNWFYDSLIIGMASFIWVNVVVSPSGILDFIPNYISQKIYKNGVTEFKKKIMKVLFYCEVCNAGQLSFWSFFLLNTEGYHLFIHFSFVVISMVTAFFTSLIYQKLKSN
jgi:hypothetical protein